MATISGSVSDKVYPLKIFLGLHENPDGDTKLKMGEAAICRNWKITRDNNLQRRPGLKTIMHLPDVVLSGGEYSYTPKPVQGMWTGYVAGNLVCLAACDGKLYEIYGDGSFTKQNVGTVHATNHVHIFGFSGKAYIMDGSSYYVWDGSKTGDTYNNRVEVKDSNNNVYIPLVANVIGPDGTSGAGGELLEGINKLSSYRRAWLSPDGTNKVFSLPETGIAGVDSITNTSDGSAVTGWSANTSTGKITFTNAPTAGANTLEVKWHMSSNFRTQVTAMKYSELFSGAADSRVFIYGDGTNQIFYSGMDYNGQPRADYFPDLNVIGVGDSNTPVTALIRHFSRLVVYKLESTWVVSESTLTLADGSIVAAYYCTSVNKAIGNVAPGQVYLVMNSPRTLFGDDLYEWHGSSYSGNLTNDERQAKRISDRVYATLRGFRADRCVCWDDNDNQEYYICYNHQALVHNYASDAWYYYDHFDAVAFTNINGDLYVGTSDGLICRLDALTFNDNIIAYDENDELILDDNHDLTYEKYPIFAYWESGSLSFNSEYSRKYSSAIWVSVKPESSSFVEITIITDKKKENASKVIAYGGGGFEDWDFNTIDFADAEMTQIKKVRIKAKKFSYYKLVFTNDKTDSTGTVLSANMRVRETGYVK